MSTYNTIAENPSSTVVAEYISECCVAEGHQSEHELELEFIHLLETNGYEYLNITQNEDLLSNLRVQLSRLNDMAFSEIEWQ